MLHIGSNNPKLDYVMNIGNKTFNIDKCEEEKDLGIIFNNDLLFVATNRRSEKKDET